MAATTYLYQGHLRFCWLPFTPDIWNYSTVTVEMLHTPTAGRASFTPDQWREWSEAQVHPLRFK